MANFAAYAAAAAVVYLLWRLTRDYFVRSPLDNIPGPPRASLIKGNMSQITGQGHWEFIENVRATYGPIMKFYSYFGVRWLHVYDTKALHSMFIKDQDSYYRGEQSIAVSRLLIGPGLLGTHGHTHKKQRKMLNPVFSVAHMRNLMPLFYSITDRLRAALETRVKDGPQEMDILMWMGRTALELIGQGGLGHSFDPLVEESSDSFAEAVKAFVPSFAEVLWARVAAPYVKYMGPAWFRRILVDLIPIPSIQRVKTVNDIVFDHAKRIIAEKKAALKRGDQELLHMVGEGKDIISIMLRANMSASEEDRLPDDELLAQMSTFIIAGVDTTSNAMSRMLHLLADNQDVQDKLRKELLEAREQYDGMIPYDELSQLPYLDAVCRETLRLHAPINMINRQAMRDTVLPLAEPIRGLDGTVLHEIPVPKGTVFFCNLRLCNTNEALWGEDAQEWKPERWLKPLPRTVEEANIPGIYANLVTFISGSNSCIGFKFSQLEMKVVMSTLISTFKFERSDKPIYWKFAGIAYPALNRESMKPELNLKVSLA
ncbi:cytochrome P450 [Daedaleopsis nitida]|nr:cytochrome P450 [Daedaleopsis nitida]